MNESGELFQSLNKETKPASVQRSFSQRRNLESWVQVLWIVESTSSSASSNDSRERVRRVAPMEVMRSQRGGDVVGAGKRRERCSRLWRFEMAVNDESVRRKHFLILRRLRLGQLEMSCKKVSSSIE